jgi:predicted RNase H-like HicB family nuclease
MWQYTALIFQDPNEPDGWLGAVPAVAGVVSQGATRQEALSMTQEALELMLSVMLEDKAFIPNDLVDLSTAKSGWQELLNAKTIEFFEYNIQIKLEVMAVAA